MTSPGDAIQARHGSRRSRPGVHTDNPEYVTEYVGNLTTNRHIAVCGCHVIGTSVGNHVFALDAQTGAD